MESPCSYCPVVIECQTLNEVSKIHSESLLAQAGHIAEAVSSRDKLNVSLDLAILSGEVTAEESQQLEQQLDKASQESLGKTPTNYINDALERIPLEVSELDTFDTLLQKLIGSQVL